MAGFFEWGFSFGAHCGRLRVHTRNLAAFSTAPDALHLILVLARIAFRGRPVHRAGRVDLAPALLRPLYEVLKMNMVLHLQFRADIAPAGAVVGAEEYLEGYPVVGGASDVRCRAVMCVVFVCGRSAAMCVCYLLALSVTR